MSVQLSEPPLSDLTDRLAVLWCSVVDTPDELLATDEKRIPDPVLGLHAVPRKRQVRLRCR